VDSLWSSLPPLLALSGGAVAVAGDLFSVNSLIALLTLAALEIVLGIDNVIFIAILAGKLPAAQQGRAASTSRSRSTRATPSCSTYSLQGWRTRA